ncbi:unnamed protein product [Brassica oleracea]
MVQTRLLRLWEALNGTRTAYNEESQSTQRLMITISIEGVCSCEEDSTFNPTKYGGLKKIERMTLGELNDYLLKSQPQVAVAQDLQDWDLPQCLQEIVGSTLNFQLSLSHFNFSAIHQSFAVSRIF